MTDSEGSSIRAATGVVKWFDPRKGFGFIVGPSGQDVLAHFSNIEGGGFRILKDGWVVVFDAYQTPKGWKATRIIRPPGADEESPPTSPVQPTPRPPTDAAVGSASPPPNVVIVRKAVPRPETAAEPERRAPDAR